MASIVATTSSPRSATDHELLLRETNHRCSNDLQLVVSLLALQSRRAASAEVRQAFADVMERVAVLARARSSMHVDRPPSLETALRQLCAALHAQAEPRAISVSLQAEAAAEGLSAARITTLALVVNELAINAIKHAFEEGMAGQIRVSISRGGGRDVTVIVDDDGLPFPAIDGNATGLGMGLVKRMMASIDGLFIPPPPGTKTFELRVPVEAD